MAAVPAPSAFERRTNAAFEAVMWALSRPGRLRRLPEPGPAVLAEALIDRECAVHCEDPALGQLVARLGAATVPLEEADHVFLQDLTPRTAARLRQGSDLYPDDGATMICSATLGSGTGLRLTGPGCDGSVEVRVGGVPDGFWQARARAARYPMGFELLLVDGDRLLGLPRSTHMEVT